jgi:hypothetical protein
MSKRLIRCATVGRVRGSYFDWQICAAIMFFSMSVQIALAKPGQWIAEDNFSQANVFASEHTVVYQDKTSFTARTQS